MAISTMESAKDSKKKDEFIPEAKYREPMHTLLSAMHDKVDELITKINAIDTATNANTSKVSMTLGTTGSTALAGDTNIVTIGSSTTIAFGDMITSGKGTKIDPYVYTIVMTVSKGGVSKTTTLTLS